MHGHEIATLIQARDTRALHEVLGSVRNPEKPSRRPSEAYIL